jgi:hypothetical protein
MQGCLQGDTGDPQDTLICISWHGTYEGQSTSVLRWEACWQTHAPRRRDAEGLSELSMDTTKPRLGVTTQHTRAPYSAGKTDKCPSKPCNKSRLRNSAALHRSRGKRTQPFRDLLLLGQHPQTHSEGSTKSTCDLLSCTHPPAHSSDVPHYSPSCKNEGWPAHQPPLPATRNIVPIIAPTIPDILGWAIVLSLVTLVLPNTKATQNMAPPGIEGDM